MIEYMSRLQLFANKKKAQAELKGTSALAAEFQHTAAEAENRKKKIAESQHYEKWTGKALVSWLDAKYMQAELAAKEAETRVKLTWQEFDRCLCLRRDFEEHQPSRLSQRLSMQNSQQSD